MELSVQPPRRGRGEGSVTALQQFVHRLDDDASLFVLTHCGVFVSVYVHNAVAVGKLLSVFRLDTSM